MSKFFISEKLLSSGFGVTMLSMYMYSQYECLSCFCTWCLSCLYLSFRSLFPLFFMFLYNLSLFFISVLVLDVTYDVLGLEDNFFCGICWFTNSLSLVLNSFHISSTDIVFALL